MKTLIHTISAAALISAAAAGAQAATFHQTLENPDVNAAIQTIVDAPATGFALLDPSTSYDINGKPVIGQRSQGEAFMATSNQRKAPAADPFATYDINGRALPSGF